MRLNLNLSNKSIVAKLAAGLFVFALVFPSLVHGVLVANYTECGYGEECPIVNGGSAMGLDGVSRGGRGIIGQYIVVGAGHFLEGTSVAFQFMNKVELGELYGVNYDELNGLLEDAILEFEQARDTYVQLLEKANATSYNEAVIRKLMAFDFDGFRESKGLNSDVFAEVRDYMAAGDLRGYYLGLQLKVEDILNALYQAKPYIENATLPPLEGFWRVNQKCTETLLFGQYSAEIFKRIN